MGEGDRQAVITNPHEYDDDKFLAAYSPLQDGLYAMWKAGVTLDDLSNEIAVALENACEIQVEVAIHEVVR